MGMEALEYQAEYGPQLASQIESMGKIARMVANRWMMGWPEQSKALVKEGTYLRHLETQTNLEKDVLSEAGHLQHLSWTEILKMNEIREAPPALQQGIKST